MMTTRDYIILAEAFAGAYDAIVSDTARSGVTKSIRAVADALERDNPRFNRLTFYVAAKVPQRSGVYQMAVKAARIRSLNDLNS